MADSYITKRALATSLRELMQEQPFDKISVSQICDGCGMNRKSFYYHFKDKYDLVNWIFDTDFITMAKDVALDVPYTARWDLVEKACRYFYENHSFYRKALQIKGQNSFSEHFREYVRPLLQSRITKIFGRKLADEFTLDFLTDAVLCALERWLLTKDCMPPEVFVNKLKDIVEMSAHALCTKMSESDVRPQA